MPATSITPLSANSTATRAMAPRSASPAPIRVFFLVDARDGALLRHHFFMDPVDLLQLRAVVFEGHHPQLRSALVDVGFVLDGA